MSELDNNACEVTESELCHFHVNQVLSSTPIENDDDKIIQQFDESLKTIFKTVNESSRDNDFVQSISSITKKQLKYILYQSATLKSCGLMKNISCEKLLKLLYILEQFTIQGNDISLMNNNDISEEDDQEEMGVVIPVQVDKILTAADATITSLLILTSPNMPVEIFLEGAIDNIIYFTQYHLKTNVLPSFYNDKIQTNFCVQKPKVKKQLTGKERKKMKIHMVYETLQEIINLLCELVCVCKMPDEALFHLSFIGIAPIFVENMSFMQSSSLKLITQVFQKYENHRKLILEEIIGSIHQISKVKLTGHKYCLFSKSHISMLAALILLLIQSTVALPSELPFQSKSSLKERSVNIDKKTNKEKSKKDVTSIWDNIISKKYEDAFCVSGHFINGFLNKCVKNKNEVDCRPVLETFFQDLLTTLNKPEWPASELLLDLFGRLLSSHIRNKNCENSIRVLSLEYLGNIATAIKRELVKVSSYTTTIDQLTEILTSQTVNENSEEKCIKKQNTNTKLRGCSEDEKCLILQEFLLNYLIVSGENDDSFLHSRHFHIVQWWKDNTLRETEKEEMNENVDSKNEASAKVSKERSKKHKIVHKEGNKKAFKDQLPPHMQLLISKINPSKETGFTKFMEKEIQLYVEYETAEQVSRYLASARPFYKYFAVYLQLILRSLAETTISIRTKAMKCLSAIVEVDPSTLARNDVHKAVCSSFLDHSILVREHSVDLVGKYVLRHKELLGKYYPMLVQRILDTGVSVRKRVISILKDIYLTYPEFEKTGELCVKIIHRLNDDEEKVRKLVPEVFQEMWFTIKNDSPRSQLISRVSHLIKTVTYFQETDNLLLEKLLQDIFKPSACLKNGKEASKSTSVSSKDIVDCLIGCMLKIEENTLGSGDGVHNTQLHLVTTLGILRIFAKICPKAFADHVQTLQPHLSINCQTNGDLMIIKYVVQTLDMIVPVLDHPSEVFLSDLEEIMLKHVLRLEPSIVQSCLSCLATVNKITNNNAVVQDLFDNYYSCLSKYCDLYVKDVNSPLLNKLRPCVRRCIFTLGLMIQHFSLERDIVQKVFSLLMFFVDKADKDFLSYSLKAIGAACARYYDYMLDPPLMSVYKKLLTVCDTPIELVLQILNNLQLYLKEEQIRLDNDKEIETRYDLKTMGNNSSEVTSRVIQSYLHTLLQLLLHVNGMVRNSALLVVQIGFHQGFIEPLCVIPYLICLATNSNPTIKCTAEKLLEDIEKKFPRLIFMKCQMGMELSYMFQLRVQSSQNESDNKLKNGVIQGYRCNENDSLEGLNCYIYRLFRRSIKSRRAFIKILLKVFERENPVSFSQLLYLVHNLAYFPYQTQDEPLFVIHEIDFMVPLNGRNLLDSFDNSLLPVDHKSEGNCLKIYEDDEIDKQDEDALMVRIPENTTVLHRCISVAQGYILLVDLREYLRILYGLNSERILEYRPDKSSKLSDKIVKRSNIPPFIPRITNTNCSEDDIKLDKRQLVQKYLEFARIIVDLDE